MNGTESQAMYGKGFNLALLGLGLLLIVGALQFRFLLPAPPAFLPSILMLLGVGCLVVCLLRWRGAPAAFPATMALSLVLLFAFPLGTALSLYWLTSVRRKETPPQDESQRTWFHYTVMLHVFGMMLLVTFLLLRALLGPAGPEDQTFLNWFEASFVAVALASILVGILRSTNLRRAHRITLSFNVFLALWFPVGTVLALIWLVAVRKHEMKLLSG